MSDTDKHVSYSTGVATLAEAWAFVMEHVDEFPNPSIKIQAIIRGDMGLTEENTQGFGVRVYGSVKL